MIQQALICPWSVVQLVGVFITIDKKITLIKIYPLYYHGIIHAYQSRYYNNYRDTYI